jgi:hypothetical protein
MKHVLLAAALAAAAPALAQSAPASPDSLPDALLRALEGVQTSKARTAPAAVDPQPVAALFERLAKDGEQIATVDGTEDAYQRDGAPDRSGRRQDLQVGVVELPDPADADDGTGAPRVRDLVLRRVFSTLEAESRDWTVKKDGSGRLDLWHFTVSLDGYLLAVEHDAVPVKAGADGKPQPQIPQMRVETPAPSDPKVLARWKALSQKLLTLGRTTAI